MSYTEGEPTFEDLLRLVSSRAGDGQIGDLPAKVVAYDATKQTVKAQPLVLVPIGGELKPAPIAIGLQIRWPAGSSWSIVGELLPGDFGWIRTAGADISAWRIQGIEQSPNAIPRKGALSDAVFEPGSQPISVPLPSAAYAAGALVIRAAQLLLGDSSATKAVGLHQDQVNRTLAPPDSMTAWMTLVEGVCNTVAPGTFTPANNALSFTLAGLLAATASKVKAI